MNIHIIHSLIKIKNALNSKKEWTLIKYQKDVFNFLIILYKENLIQSFKYVNIKNQNYILVYLTYSYNCLILKNLKIVATKSKSIYLSYFDLCKIINKCMYIMVSTNKGILSDIEAKKFKQGGRLLLVC